MASENISQSISILNLETNEVILSSGNVSDRSSDHLTSCRKSLFPSDDVDIDEDDSESKPVEEWKEIDTKKWLISTSLNLGIAYGAVPCELGISGQALLDMKRPDFIRLAPTFGEKLYDLLQELPCRRSLFSSNDVGIDEDDWESKPVEEWKEIDTKKWLISISTKLGIAYGAVPCELAISGRELVNLKRSDLIGLHRAIGEKLYNLLRKNRVKNPPAAKICESGPKVIRKRSGGGRPRIRKHIPIWQFVIDWLHNPEHCPSKIKWEDYAKRKIRFVDPPAIGRLWGGRRGNKKMIYANFSRALRNYRSIIWGVGNMRLVFQFAKNVPGLETDDPNFTKARDKMIKSMKTSKFADRTDNGDRIPSLGNVSDRSSDHLSCRNSLFPSDEVDTDEDDWKSKPAEEWKEIDVKKWLISTSVKLEIAYGAVPCELAIPGRELVNLKRSDLIRLHRAIGEKLYDLLQENLVKNPLSSNSVPIWQSVIDWLHSPEHCPSKIKWEDYEKRKIRFVDPPAIARLWGGRNNNEGMDFRKFSRALRHHPSIISKVARNRLVYQLARNVPGLETDDPNFTKARNKMINPTTTSRLDGRTDTGIDFYNV